MDFITIDCFVFTVIKSVCIQCYIMKKKLLLVWELAVILFFFFLNSNTMNTSWFLFLFFFWGPGSCVIINTVWPDSPEGGKKQHQVSSQNDVIFDVKNDHFNTSCWKYYCNFQISIISTGLSVLVLPFCKTKDKKKDQSFRTGLDQFIKSELVA